MLVSDEEVSVLTRGAHTEVLDRLGRDFKTWKQNAWLWSELSVEFFEKGTLPDDRDAALAAWKAQRPKTVFEFRCRMWAFRSERHDIRWTTACCLYAAPAFEHHVTAGRALEGWLAGGFEERGVPTEWYVTGKRPDCADRFFRE